MLLKGSFINRVLLVLACNLPFFSCNEGRISEGSKKLQDIVKPSVTARYQTEPVPAGVNEDSADDPAIYIAAQHPDSVYIIGTNKKGGLAVYSITGKQLNYYPFGKANNVDVRYDFPYNGVLIDIVAFSNRTTHSTDIYQIDKSGVLFPLSVGKIVSNFEDEVYGFCLYKNPVNEQFYAFINCKQGSVEQYLFWNQGDSIAFEQVRAFSLPSQTEGMVADDALGIVYIGEEGNAIWKYNADPKSGTKGTMLQESIASQNANITADIEGIAMYPTSDTTGYIVASSQGNYTYAIFEREGDNKYVGSFKVLDGIIDGIEETDGVEVCSISLPEFPNGFAVMQDGYNYEGEQLYPQNFKIVDWNEIKKAVEFN